MMKKGGDFLSSSPVYAKKPRPNFAFTILYAKFPLTLFCIDIYEYYLAALLGIIRRATEYEEAAMLFVEYPKCSTCKKAKKWLDKHGVAYEDRDIKLDNPTEDELRAWHEASGLPLKRFFNTSGMLYRDMGLKDKLPDMSEDEQFALLASDGMLVKRPIAVTDGSGVLVGFKEAEWAERLA